MQDSEIWKDIPGYNGRYQASTLGRIRSTDRTVIKSNGVSVFYKGKILEPFVSTGGYLYVRIADEINNFHPKRVHRLIALTFILNPNNYTEINHIDEIRMNNKVENLEWCTKKYNTNYGHCIEKSAKKRINTPSLSREVNQYDLNGNFLRSFPSATEAARFLGRKIDITACRIGQCCRGIFKSGNSAYGYLWKFATSENKGKSIEKLQVGFPIYQYSLDNKFIKKWENMKSVVEALKLNYSNISRAIKYNRTCGGYKWSKTAL